MSLSAFDSPTEVLRRVLDRVTYLNQNKKAVSIVFSSEMTQNIRDAIEVLEAKAKRDNEAAVRRYEAALVQVASGLATLEAGPGWIAEQAAQIVSLLGISNPEKK